VTTTIPNRPVGSDARNISAILADFDAIIAVLDAHIAAGAQDELPGVIKPYALPTAPAGYMLCDGSPCVAVTPLRTALIAAGSPFGVSGANPLVPDLRGRTALGVGTATGAVGATAHTLGQKGGEEKHVLTTAEMPSHSHALPINYTGLGPSPTPAAGNSVLGSNGTTFAAGSGTSHNILEPYIGLNWIIKT